jgi:hypothetical protein
VVTDLDIPELNSPDGVLCDVCGISEAVLAGHYPGIRARPPRWCGPCGGQTLADLVTDGQIVTVTSTDHATPGTTATATDPRAVTTPAGAGAEPDAEIGGEVGIADLPWTVEYAVELLRYARPGGLAFARALVDEGGTATAARLREILGVTALNSLTATLNAAVRTAVGRGRLRYPDRHLAKPLPPPEDPRRKNVHSYALPPELVALLDEALTALGRPPGATDHTGNGPARGVMPDQHP